MFALSVEYETRVKKKKRTKKKYNNNMKYFHANIRGFVEWFNRTKYVCNLFKLPNIIRIQIIISFENRKYVLLLCCCCDAVVFCGYIYCKYRSGECSIFISRPQWAPVTWHFVDSMMFINLFRQKKIYYLR